MQEIWKPVVGYEGLYEISSFARCRSSRTGRLMMLNQLGNIYPAFHLTKNRISKYIPLAIIYAQAFIPNPNGYTGVRAKNGLGICVNSGNIEWVFDDSVPNVHVVK